MKDFNTLMHIAKSLKTQGIMAILGCSQNTFPSLHWTWFDLMCTNINLSRIYLYITNFTNKIQSKLLLIALKLHSLKFHHSIVVCKPTYHPRENDTRVGKGQKCIFLDECPLMNKSCMLGISSRESGTKQPRTSR
jgi:hypothetical protein